MKRRTPILLLFCLAFSVFMLWYVFALQDRALQVIVCGFYLVLLIRVGPPNWQALRIRWATRAGNTAQEQGRYPDAEWYFKRAAALADRGRGRPVFRGVTLANLANLYRAQGRIAEAEPLFQESLQLLTEHLKPGDRNLALTRNLYGLLLLEKKEFKQAEQVLWAAFAALEDGPEANSLTMAGVAENLAEAYRGLDQLKEAEPLCRRCLKIREKALGADDPRVLENAQQLAGLLRSLGRKADAAKVEARTRDRAAELSSSAPGPQEPKP